MSNQIYMTRADAGIGAGLFDSIAWAFEAHLREPDTHEYHFAVLRGWHEDSPERIEFWRAEPNHDTPADRVWLADISLAG